MRLPSTRALVALAFVLLVGGAGASTGAGARSKGPRPVAVRLLAHDTSTRLDAHAPAVRPRPVTSAILFPGLRLPRAHGANRAARRVLAAAPSLGLNFAGASQPAGTFPSDANGDIGRTQYVQAVNGRYSVYSRTSLLLGRLTSTQFWSGLSGPDAAGLCATDPSGEPSVVYDRLADRWVVSELAFAVDGSGAPQAPFVLCVAVSTSADATGTWSRYVFQASTPKFPDAPKLSLWPDGYYLSFNQYDAASGAFAGAGALALERSQMLTGGAAQGRYFDLASVNPGLGGMMPASMSWTNLPPAGSPALYVQAYDDPTDANDRLELWQFHVDWTSPISGSTFQPLVTLPVAAFSSAFACPDGSGGTKPSCVRQFGDPQTLDAGSNVGTFAAPIPQLNYRVGYVHAPAGSGETMVVSQTVNAGGNVAALRWYQLQNAGAGWGVSRQDTWSSGDDHFNGSVALDNSGDVAAGATVSGSIAPSIAVTSQGAAEALGAMSASETYPQLGSAPQQGTDRWGDYSSLSIDPLDGCTFWYTGQYEAVGGWRTRVVTFDVPGCTAVGSLPPTLTGDPTESAPLYREGQTLTAGVATWSGATGTSLQWRRCDSTGSSCVDLAGQTAATHVLTAADAAGDRTIRLQARATNASGASVAATTATPIIQSLPPTNVTLPAISGTAQVGQALATTDGTWTSSSPLSFTYRWRRCGASCVDIASATSSSYTLTSADLGSTIDVTVGATNTGGGLDATAAATATVAAAPAPVAAAPPAGGGGGGGGGSGNPDLGVAISASAATAKIGDSITFRIPVTVVNNVLVFGVKVNVTLPSNLTLAFAKTDRGSGCTAPTPTTLSCDLDYLAGAAPVGTATVVGTVNGSGGVVLGANVPAVPGETVTANNSATITVAGPAAVAAPPPAFVDRTSPKVQALSSSGLMRRVVKLRFRISDDSTTAKAVVRVMRGRTTLATLSTGFGKVVPGQIYYVPWVARTAASSFCVVGTDRAGHTSASACAPLSLR